MIKSNLRELVEVMHLELKRGPHFPWALESRTAGKLDLNVLVKWHENAHECGQWTVYDRPLLVWVHQVVADEGPYSDLAQSGEHLAQILIEHGASPHIRSSFGFSFADRHVRQLLISSADVVCRFLTRFTTQTWSS